jgi:NodT family efflux transporter outer membrane factor (OMF) lipoprotein
VPALFGDLMSDVKYRSAFAATLAAMLLSSCAVGPDFVQPSAPDVDRYTREPLASRTSSTDAKFGQSQHFVNGRDIPAEWWQLFHSPQLNALIQKALVANPNLQSTLAALRAAKESVYAQYGKYFPLVQANFSPTRQLVPPAISSQLANGDNLYNLFTAQVLVTYTFDTWGLNRRTVESLQAAADSQRFQIEAAYLTLIGNVVVAAVQEASLRAQIDATNRLIDINTRMLVILRNQLKTGYENRIDVAAQEAQLAQTVATLPPLRKALAQQRDLLAALAGRFPSQEPTETFRLADLRMPVDLPVSLPAQLIEQRPDVRSAEEQLHSASALIGVAIANMLPNLSISAGSGYTSTTVGSLFTGPALFWNVAGNATQPLFDGFTLLHEERGAQAAYRQAAWSYRSTVIGAFQNVADSLRAIQNDADALKAAREFEKAAKVSLTLSQQQMQTGQANILFLLNAQQTYEQAVLQVVQAQAARVSDTAALFVALGGGWRNRVGPPAPEQTLDVATGQTAPVAEDGGWLSVITSKAWWNRSDASAPAVRATAASTQSTSLNNSSPSDVAHVPPPVITADDQSQGAANNQVGEGGKP